MLAKFFDHIPSRKLLFLCLALGLAFSVLLLLL